MLRLLFITCSCFLLPGCTIINLTYLRNFTNEPVEIWFLPGESRIGYSYANSSSPKTHFFYSKKIEDIGTRIWKQMKDSLPIIYKDKAAVITVPPNATAQLPFSSYGSQIHIKRSAKTDTIWLDKIDRTNGLRFKYGGLPTHSILYYDHQ